MHDLRHGRGRIAPLDGYIPVHEQHRAEEGYAEDLALRHPAEVERDLVGGDYVYARRVVENYDVGLAAVDILHRL